MKTLEGVMRVACFAAVMLCGTAFGQLFAVAPGPRLVTVDPDTGALAEVGPLNVVGGIASMEFVGQRLYATERLVPNGAYLLELSTVDGAVLSRVEMTVDGAGMRNAVEGLGYDEAAGSLVQAFWRTGASSISTSNTLGYLGFDGVITGVTGYGSDADFDGLATRDGVGGLYWVDREPGSNTVEIGLVTLGGAATSLNLFSFNNTLNGVNDVTLAPDRGELLAADVVTARVHRLDPATGALLGSVEVGTGEGVNTAAYRVPCPADLSPPYGLLDLADVTAFVSAFVATDPAADLAAPFGLFDLSDVTAFVQAFGAGCP